VANKARFCVDQIVTPTLPSHLPPSPWPRLILAGTIDTRSLMNDSQTSRRLVNAKKRFLPRPLNLHDHPLPATGSPHVSVLHAVPGTDIPFTKRILPFQTDLVKKVDGDGAGV